jgi:glutathione S-transferase
MQLTGSFGSPFTRRVAITLKHYNLHHSQVKLTPFGEGKDALRAVNPLTRVPVLSLETGEHLTDSQLIIDYLDTLVEPTRRLVPVEGRTRRDILNLASIATGAADKLVVTLYEHHFRPKEMVYKPWIKMCDRQIVDAFQWLNAQLVDEWFVGGEVSHADIAVAVYWLFGVGKREKYFYRMNCKALEGLAERLSETPAFQETLPEGGLPIGISPE